MLIVDSFHPFDPELKSEDMHVPSIRSSLLGLVAAGALLVGTPACAETWTSLAGSTIEAKMVGLWGDSVLLEMNNGRRVMVKLDNLQASSRIMARELGERRKTHRQTIKSEIAGRAAKAGASAPNPLPEPPAPPAYTPLKPGEDALTAWTHTMLQAENGHIIAAYDMLPPSYRKDVDGLVKSAVGKLSPMGFNSVVKSIHSIGDLIVTKQNWLLSHPRIAALEPDQMEVVESILLMVGGMVRSGMASDLMDINKMQSMPFRDWLLEFDAAVAPYLAELYSLQYLPVPEYEFDSEIDEMVVLKATKPGIPSIRLVKVEDYWVPKAVRDNWQQSIQRAKDDLNNKPDGTLLSEPAVAMMPGMVATYLAPLSAAPDAEKFHASLDQMMEPFMGQVPGMLMAAGMGMSGNSRGSNGGARGGRDGGGGLALGGNRGREEGYGEGYGGEGFESEMSMEGGEEEGYGGGDFGRRGNFEEEGANQEIEMQQGDIGRGGGLGRGGDLGRSGAGRN